MSQLDRARSHLARHKWDYLAVPDPDIPPDPPTLPSTWARPPDLTPLRASLA